MHYQLGICFKTSPRSQPDDRIASSGSCEFLLLLFVYRCCIGSILSFKVVDIKVFLTGVKTRQ